MIRNQWYIVCFEKELKNKPIGKTILGLDLLVYKDDKERVYVLEDRCCHRNVHLSLGYVNGNNIKCGYHGWEYNGKGQCVDIPSLRPDQSIPNSACIKSYHSKVQHKIVWVFIGEEDRISDAEIPPFNELNDWHFVFNYHEVKGDIKLIAESLFDAQHINHVHRGSIKTMMGNLSNEPTDFGLKVTDKSMHGNYIRYNKRSIFEKIYFGFQKELDTYFAFWFPHSSMLDLRFPKQFHFPERRMIIYEHFYEIEEGRCMMIQITTWKNIFRFNPWFAKWFMAKKSNRIVEEDIAFLESNKTWHDKENLTDLLIKPDELSFAFNKVWKNNLSDGNT